MVRTTKSLHASLDALAKRTRLLMSVNVSASEMAGQLAGELAGAHGGTGTIRLIVPLAGGGEAVVLLGRDYQLDAELAARIERITGDGTVDLSAQEPPRLALVG